MKVKRCLAAAAALLCLCGCNSTQDTGNTSSAADSSSVEVTVSQAADKDESQQAAEPSDVDSGNTEASGDSELGGVFAEISNSFVLPDMVPLNDKLLNRYYGLSPEVCTDYAGGVDSSGVGQDEIALFKAADESQVSVIEQALQTRYDSKLSQQENYNPEEAEKIRNCKVETNGLYVTLIISNDAQGITELVFNSVGE